MALTRFLTFYITTEIGIGLMAPFAPILRPLVLFPDPSLWRESRGVWPEPLWHLRSGSVMFGVLTRCRSRPQHRTRRLGKSCFPAIRYQCLAPPTSPRAHFSRSVGSFRQGFARFDRVGPSDNQCSGQIIAPRCCAVRSPASQGATHLQFRSHRNDQILAIDKVAATIPARTSFCE
jgi:hypothetical protein